MSFSSGLQPVLKQEPQTEQLKITNKSSLHTSSQLSTANIQKHDKQLQQQQQQSTTSNSGLIDSSASAVSVAAAVAASETLEKRKSSGVDLIDNHCACGSPQGNNTNNSQLVVEQSFLSIKGNNFSNDQGEFNCHL